MLHDDLRTLGFTDTEASIYTWLLRFGSAKPSDIAAATGLKRPTVYSAIGELNKKGVVSIAGADRATTASAEPPHVLQSLIEREARAIEEKRQASERIIREIYETRTSADDLVRATWGSIDEITGHLTARMHELLEHHTPEAVMGWAYTDSRTTIPLITMLQDVAAALALAIPMNILAYNRDATSKDVVHEPPLHIKPWIGPEMFPVNNVIIGNTAIYIFRKDGLYHTTEIVDTMIVEQMKSIWSVLWNLDVQSAHRDFVV